MQFTRVQAPREERATRRELDTRAELIERIAAAAREDSVVEPLPGVHLARASRSLEGIHSVYPTALCLVAQGAKEVFVGNASYRYDANRFLIATVEVPAVGRILEATPEKPYLSMRLNLDRALVGSVMVEAGLPIPRSQGDAKAIAVSELDAELLDACVRLVRLIEAPAEARVLAPW